MIPSVGRIVHYKIGNDTVSRVSESRNKSIYSGGNSLQAGEIYPLLITMIWSNKPDENTAVSGQLFLDGNDCVWITSALQGENEYQWSDPRG